MILYQGGTLVDDVRLGSTQVNFLLQGDQLLYYRRGAFDGDMGQGLSVIVDDTANKFFEIHWLMDEEMTGSVEDGFTHPSDSRLTFVVERSEDLQTWATDFLDVAAPEDQMDGTWLYKARAPVLVASMTKTGQLTLSQPTPDPRSNPLILITIADVDLPLPNYPYDLPADAATLQADLVSEGFTGATVTTSAGAYWVTVTDYAARLMPSPVNRVVIDNVPQDLPNFPYTIPGDEALLISDLEDLGWTDVAVVFQGGYEIELPNVESTGGYSQANRVEWTPYLVEDRLGDLVNLLVGSTSFQGTFVNEDDIRTNVVKQFGRVRAVWTP